MTLRGATSLLRATPLVARSLARALLVAGLAAVFFIRPWGEPPIAAAAILPPVTVDGPSTEGLSLGGVAMAPDGTGGLVYTKAVAGVTHVFASRYDGERWSRPIRVDWDQPYEASQPAIAAGNDGELMVVWVTGVATVHGKIRRGLFSARLGPGAKGFGPSLLIDPDVEEGGGVDPSLAGTVPGKAIVAYRVVTFRFQASEGLPTTPQLRPGDVLAEIRVARLEGRQWSRLGAINRDLDVSMRPPTEANGPQVGIGAAGAAVVAWQEPDLSGAARILMRRVTGTALGPIFPASPETWEGRSVGEDATAFALAVTPFDQARVAARVDGSAGSQLGGQRLFLTTLGPDGSETGAKPTGPVLVGSSLPPSPVGPPAIAAGHEGGNEGSLRLAFSAGAGMLQFGVSQQGSLLGPNPLSGPAAEPGTEAVAAVGPEGGGVTAYRAGGRAGLSVVAVREDLGGGAQVGTVSGPIGGPVSQLHGAGTEDGDALLAFRQGESGNFALVADRVVAPPARFGVNVPKRWVLPRRASIRWETAPSASGSVTYGVLIDGRAVASGLTGRRLLPRPALLGSGVRRVRVVAIDRFGQQRLSTPVKLRVDAQPPRLVVRVRPRRREVVLRLRDAQSGLVRRATRVSFGDGATVRGGARMRHLYATAGSYVIRVRARDRTGNRLARRLQVTVR